MGQALGGSIDRLGLGKYGTSLAHNMVGGIANAATRSLVNGSDFGDNLMAALPDILGNTIGNAIGDAVAGRGGGQRAGGSSGQTADDIIVTAGREHTRNILTDGLDFSATDAVMADIRHQSNSLLLAVAGGDVGAARQMLSGSFAPTEAQAIAMATPVPGATPLHLKYDASTGQPGTYDVTPAYTPDHLSPDRSTIGNITYSGGDATWTINKERTDAMNAALAQFDHDAIEGSTLGLRYGAELASGEALIGLAAKGISLWRASRAAETFSGVWKLHPFERGQQIEQALGHNLPSNFPTIDRFENGIATSIKSVDLDAATYLTDATLNRTLIGYVDKAAAFNGRLWARVNIKSTDILRRGLDLAIPHGGSASQQIIINQAVKYGATRGVVVNPIIFP